MQSVSRAPFARAVPLAADVAAMAPRPEREHVGGCERGGVGSAVGTRTGDGGCTEARGTDRGHERDGQHGEHPHRRRASLVHRSTRITA